MEYNSFVQNSLVKSISHGNLTSKDYFWTFGVVENNDNKIKILYVDLFLNLHNKFYAT